MNKIGKLTLMQKYRLWKHKRFVNKCYKMIKRLEMNMSMVGLNRGEKRAFRRSFVSGWLKNNE